MGKKNSMGGSTVTGCPIELHVCQGLNSCKGQGAGHTGTGPGDGDCSTITPTHTCAGGNKCHYQGACGYQATGAPDNLSFVPGENLCTGIGGCQIPIATQQIFKQGPYQNQNVWDRARSLFENRMTQIGQKVLPAPPANQRRQDLKPT